MQNIWCILDNIWCILNICTCILNIFFFFFFFGREGVPGDPRVDTAFEELVFQTNGVRLLGSYAQARKRG